MLKSFDDLSIELQLVLQERFSRYGMDAKYMFDESGRFSDNVKSMNDKDIMIFMDKKDISHQYPQSLYPELSSEPANVFLEDSHINRARGAEIVTTDEIHIAFEDQINDTFDLDIDEDGVIDLGNHNMSYGEDFDWFDWDNFEIKDFLFN